MPVALSSQLIPWLMRRGLWPEIPESTTQEYWRLMSGGEHLSRCTPLWLWGDEATRSTTQNNRNS